VDMPGGKQTRRDNFTRRAANPTLDKNSMRELFDSISLLAGNLLAQTTADKHKEEPQAAAEQKSSEPPNPAQFELLETKYRFETNGDSRKEVHALVKINSELGVRQFARLNFDYNRGFQSVEIPLVHITHASGGTADILPSAISDLPNPAVENFPAYQAVRSKSVRILGLEPGDLLEYRVTTTTTHSPLAPEFWLSHNFDRTGVAPHQVLELDLPKSREIQVQLNPAVPSAAIEDSGQGKEARHMYRWRIMQELDAPKDDSDSDVVVTTFASWDALANGLRKNLVPPENLWSAVWKKASELAGTARAPERRIRAIYNFVSQKIATVDIPLGATGFRARAPGEILASGYATAEDKFALFQAMIKAFGTDSSLAFTGSGKSFTNFLPTPAALSNLLVIAAIPPELAPGVGCGDCSSPVWLDPAIEVAPFGAIPASLRGRQALVDMAIFMTYNSPFLLVPNNLPFASTQSVAVTAGLDSDGTLKAKVKYLLRGDNELLLRVTFHKTPKEKQLEIAQYLALSDGFRGKVTTVKTSDPYATDTPFEVEYELTQEKFVDWIKQPVRIPALLPLPGLPEMPKKPAAEAKIELGPPLDVELIGTLRLPPGTTAQAPPGTSVKRDYATFTSEYSANENVLRFSRRLNFVSQNISGARFVDLGAFLHAVQSDQSQLFVLEKPKSPATAKPK